MVDSLANLPEGSKVIAGKYHLLHTLGSGVTSKVKLAKKLDTGVHCAVKIHTNPNQNDVESLSKEIEILQNIPHKNLINLMDFIEQDTVQVKSGGAFQDHKVVYFVVVLELAQGGEMIQHLLQGGELADNYARFYFRQLISALSHLHSNNIVHRDLKPDNILFDQNFNLKLADFGFAGSSATKADGKFTTYCGTQAYMAPEILLLNQGQTGKYNGFAADVFSAGVVLFVMARGIPPFFTASADDRYFKIMALGRWDLYWKQHMKNTSKDLDPAFQELIQGVLELDPEKRWTMEQVQNSAWFNGALPTEAEIVTEMVGRKQKCDAEAAKERAHRAQEKIAAGKGGKKYRGAEDEDDYDDEESLEKMKKLKVFAQELLDSRRTPYFFMSSHPLAMEKRLTEVADENANLFEFETVENKPFKFNLKVTVTRQSLKEIDEDDEELADVVADTEDANDTTVDIALEVMKHPTDKEQFILALRQNGENWASAADFKLATVELAQAFGDFADEE